MTVICTLKAAATEGVPLKTPAGLSVSVTPLGRPVAVQVYGPIPPMAVKLQRSVRNPYRRQ